MTIRHNEPIKQDEKDIYNEPYDDGFFDFYFHRVYITKPKNINGEVLNINPFIDYMRSTIMNSFQADGLRVRHMFECLLTFKQQGELTIPTVRDMYNLRHQTEADAQQYLASSVFNQEKKPDGLYTLFYGFFSNHLDFVDALGFLGLLLHEAGYDETTDVLTYERDLPYILAFLAYSREIVIFGHDASKQNPMYYKNVPTSGVVSFVQVVLDRIEQFDKMYRGDNAVIPYGYARDGCEKGLCTNLARITRSYTTPLCYVFNQSDEVDVTTLDETQIHELLVYNQDLERLTRKQMQVYVGDYSVVYNPLLNRMFVWDFSREHMADL